MKRILTILLIALCFNTSAQTVERDNPYFPNAAQVLTTNILAVSLDAIGDGLRDNAWITHDSRTSKWGHLANAGSVACLLVVPLGQGFDFQEWCWYIASYTLIRIAIFDPIYNATRGLPWDYHGQSSNWDVLVNNKLKAPDGEIMMRLVTFSVGVTIPIQQWHLKNRRNN